MAIQDQFRHKTAMLLADMSVELYSTDIPPTWYVMVDDGMVHATSHVILTWGGLMWQSVQLVGADYQTSMCSCNIRDIACLTCGNTIGYHITMPCQACLHSCNNGHFWMFRTEGVVAADRLNVIGNRLLLWGQLPKPDLDRDTPCLMWAAPSKADKHENEYSYIVNTVEPDTYDLMCR